MSGMEILAITFLLAYAVLCILAWWTPQLRPVIAALTAGAVMGIVVWATFAPHQTLQRSRSWRT